MNRTRTTAPNIEALEARIAPAGVITISGDAKSATWTDADGDKVSLKITRGALDVSLFDTDQSPATGLLVRKLDLSDPQFTGSGVSLSAVRDPLLGGDNTVNLGHLDATGHTLGAVTINGDLGRIDAGNPAPIATTPKAISSLTVLSMGMLDGALLPTGTTQTSEIVGKVGPVKVRGSVNGILFNVTGGDLGSIDSLSIGGSLIGTDEADSGRFSASGKIGAIKVKGSILGGAGQHSGSIEAGAAIASLSIGGSLLGGRSDTPSTDGTGVVRTDATMGAVTIGGSLHGGTQQDSGLISSGSHMGAVKIGGGIIGGSGGTTSGAILVGGNVASISIKGDVLGGAALDSGIIQVDGKAGAISLSGSLTGGEGEGGGSVRLGTDATDTAVSLSIARNVTGGDGDNSGAVQVAGRLGSLKIGGALHGGSGEGSGAIALTSGAGNVSIGGDIEGGVGVNSGRLTAAGTLGALSVGGNLLGGDVDGSGAIVTTAGVGKLSIAGSVIGGDLSDTATADLVGSGLIQVARVKDLSIRGAVHVGENYNATHQLVNNAAIRVQHDVGTLSIVGAIEGTAETTAVITARGQETLAQNQLTDVAFGKVTLGSSVRHALILGGYDTTADFTAAEANPNAQIGEVSVAGDWIASSLVAGAKWNDNFGGNINGVATDAKSTVGFDQPNIISTIARIKIAGQIIGTGDIADDHFGFVAQHIVEMKIGPTGSALVLNAFKRNDNDPTSLRYNVAGTGDVRLFEIS
jgi:hypothetical protein